MKLLYNFSKMESDMTAPKPLPNLSFIVMMLLAALTSFITAYLVMFGRYIEIGYKESADGIAYAGMQIWDLHHPFIVLTVLLYICAAISFLWQKFLGKPLSLPKASVLLLGLVFLAMTFFPYPFEFQVRHYTSNSDATYIHLSEASESFTGSHQTEEVEDFYDEDWNTRRFKCITKDQWWWGKLFVSHNFYPILDKENELKLLESRCQEIKQ